MSDHDTLQEKYEDSLFALLMDEYAQSEGERLIQENERLLQDPSAEVPAESERRFLRTIQRETSKRSHKRSRGKILRIIGRFAIGALIAVLLFGTAFALSPAFRASTLNLLMQIDDRVASWTFVKDDSETRHDASFLPEVSVGWLPDGYVGGAPVLLGDYGIDIDCINNNEGLISISLQKIDITSFNFDMEDIDFYANVNINGLSGVLVQKNNMSRVVWVDISSEIAICVLSESVDSDTLIRIAENISVFW